MKTKLSSRELAALERVAEGMSGKVDEAEAARLIEAGLVIRRQPSDPQGLTLELSPAGLRRIRSSDQ